MDIIFVFPLVPVAIAVLLLGFGIINELQEMIDIIANISWVIIALVIIFLVVCNFSRCEETIHKIIAIPCLGVVTFLLVDISSDFFNALRSIPNDSVWGTLDFGLTLIIGGMFWLLACFACMRAGMFFVDEDECDNWRYVKGGAILVGCFLFYCTT